MRITTDRARPELLSKPRDKQWRLSKTALAVCRFIPVFLTGKYKDSVGQKAHRLSAQNRFM